MDKIQISIIIPAYNAENYLEQTLQSVLKQTFKEFEVIVVNDASEDGTEKLAHKFMEQDNRVRYFKNEVNMGVSATRNFAISQAKFSWIAFLDSDDLWACDKLEKQLNVLNKHPDAALIYTGSRYFNENNKIDAIVEVPQQVNLKQLLKKNVIPCSSVLMRREDLLRIPMEFDDAHEDYLLWLKVLKERGIAYGINEPLLCYRFRNDSRSGDKKKSIKMTWKTFRYFELNYISCIYYMLHYAAKSLRKYRNIENRNKKEMNVIWK